MAKTYPERCAFYKLCDGDFITAQNSIDLLKDLKELKARHVFLRDIAVSYARPFAGSKGIEVTEHRLQLKFVPRKYLALHKELVNLRNQIFAHTDLTYRKPKVADFSSGEIKWFPMAFKGYDYNSLFIKIDDISDLIKGVQDNLRKEIFQIEKSI